MTEAQAGTRDTPVSHVSRPLLILAADNRSRLERDLYGLTAAPTNVPGGTAPDLVWSVDGAAGLPGTADSVGS
jgi:hypothetical protein